jgi:fumarate hydratase, class II
MSQAAVRIEKESLDEVPVPADKLWGAQTQRLLEHFSIGQELDPAGDESASALLLSTLSLVVTVPVMIAISR